jgi:hypothetical protein
MNSFYLFIFLKYQTEEQVNVCGLYQPGKSERYPCVLNIDSRYCGCLHYIVELLLCQLKTYFIYDYVLSYRGWATAHELYGQFYFVAN